MKKVFCATLLFIVLISNLGHAHNLWLETPQKGEIGVVHTVKIYYGEYTYNYYEKVDENFKDVDDFTLWLFAPSGQKTALNVEKGGETYYQAEFRPEEAGEYQLVLVSDEIQVVDWTDYGLGILKPNFFAFAAVHTGKQSSADYSISEAPLIIEYNSEKVMQGSAIQLSVSFKDEILPEQELVVSVADQWTKTIYTDKDGKAELMVPWATQYVIETVFTEEVEGRFSGTEYEAVRHTSTLTFSAQ